MVSSSAWSALGQRFTVSGGTPAADDSLALLLGGLDPSPATEGDERFELTRAETVAIDTGLPVTDVLTGLVGSINHAALDGGEGNLLLHAAAVARPDGGCLVLCGASGSGKSTLTAALVAGGLGYVTDETVCLDPVSLRITPYRKPLSLKVGAQQHLPHLAPSAELPVPHEEGSAWLVAPSRLGPYPDPPERLHPDLVVFLTWSTAHPPGVRDLTTGETAFLAGRNSSRLAVTKGGPLTALARLGHQVPGFRMHHHDSDSAAAAVHDLWSEVAR
ncbi:hypothetical protein RHODO2019_17100 [Rhodococcus antarcticus]|uniref:Hpr(Ser) kinase/phosphatase n=1 Tax=Rhodococcus antarcticus TaxID=2987751 RepID=A0ABY6P006_9NOCA|nr:hypothetical protein [Rhodococcus antarcticus]UZJ24799.1 hypothetical protein RHODO2019_17100 [Rhodococcus antarcticus]